MVNHTFRYRNAPSAQKVIVTGTFDDWKAETEMTKGENDEWTRTLDLQEGTVVYKFVVDGTWGVAEDQPMAEDSEGHTNNTVTISRMAAEDQAVESVTNLQQPAIQETPIIATAISSSETSSGPTRDETADLVPASANISPEVETEGVPKATMQSVDRAEAHDLPSSEVKLANQETLSKSRVSIAAGSVPSVNTGEASGSSQESLTSSPTPSNLSKTQRKKSKKQAKEAKKSRESLEAKVNINAADSAAHVNSNEQKEADIPVDPSGTAKIPESIVESASLPNTSNSVVVTPVTAVPAVNSEQLPKSQPIVASEPAGTAVLSLIPHQISTEPQAVQITGNAEVQVLQEITASPTAGETAAIPSKSLNEAQPMQISDTVQQVSSSPTKKESHEKNTESPVSTTSSPTKKPGMLKKLKRMFSVKKKASPSASPTATPASVVA